MVVEDNSKTDDCYYLFEMDTNVLCPVKPSKLSGGSIFLIVWVLQRSQRDHHTISGNQEETLMSFAHTLHVMFLFAVHSVFSCLAVYLTGGFLYQRLVVGAKGVEQFPNYAFWSQIGNLSAVGVNNTYIGLCLLFQSFFSFYEPNIPFYYPNRTDVISSADPVVTERNPPHTEVWLLNL